MEFTYNGFNGRIVHNPTDFILRLENVESRRIYEQTFFASNFEEVAVLGGLEFVERVMRSAFGEVAETGVSVSSFVPSVHSVLIELMYVAPVLPRPVVMSLCVPAVKKASAAAEVSDLDRRVREIEPRLDAVEKSVAGVSDSIPPQMAKMSDLIRAMMEKITALEERCSDHIVLPGCPFAIPTDIKHITLVRNATSMKVPGYIFINHPGMKLCSVTLVTGGHCGRAAGSWIPDSGPSKFKEPDMTNLFGSGNSWTPTTNTYGFSNMLCNITQLKYLTKCTTLVIHGTSEVADYSTLGDMTWLQHLEITDSFRVREDMETRNQSDTATTASGLHVPSLADITWIKSLKNLTGISFRGCKKLVDVMPLRELPNLKRLDIRETGVRDTSFLPQPGLTITRS